MATYVTSVKYRVWWGGKYTDECRGPDGFATIRYYRRWIDERIDEDQ